MQAFETLYHLLVDATLDRDKSKLLDTISVYKEMHSYEIAGFLVYLLDHYLRDDLVWVGAILEENGHADIVGKMFYLANKFTPVLEDEIVGEC